MERITLKRTQRIQVGHAWIFSNELASSPKNLEPGALVEVYDAKSNFIGIGYSNPHSLIAIRLLTREREEIDAGFFRKRITRAREFRQRFPVDQDSYRAVYSESDFLPGLIVDKYADCLVVQLLTLGMDRMRDLVLAALDEIFSPATIVLRNDSQSRVLEGLPLEKEVVKGNLDILPIIHEGGVSFEIDPLAGQKTGFFLDQRENRLALSALVKSGKGLDLFCYVGAWGLHLAKQGAQVTGVDDSETAISRAKRNAALNSLDHNARFIKADVFNFLKREREQGGSYDFIVLDPPAFVKSKAKVKEALRGYRDINAAAMKVLKRGGILATASCSYHIDWELFLEMLQGAAKDAAREVRVLEYRSQAKDHPVLLSMPETRYLKCVFLEG